MVKNGLLFIAETKVPERGLSTRSALIVIHAANIVENTIEGMSKDIVMVGKMLKKEYKILNADNTT